MRKEKTLFIIGILVSILSFLGFPTSLRKILFLIIGFFIVYMSYLFYLEARARISKDIGNNRPFIDNIEEKK